MGERVRGVTGILRKMACAVASNRICGECAQRNCNRCQSGLPDPAMHLPSPFHLISRCPRTADLNSRCGRGAIRLPAKETRTYHSAARGTVNFYSDGKPQQCNFDSACLSRAGRNRYQRTYFGVPWDCLYEYLLGICCNCIRQIAAPVVAEMQHIFITYGIWPIKYKNNQF